jgi:trans-aconitate 2-methyltransferase
VQSDWDAATYDRVSDPQARWAVTVIERIEGSIAVDASESMLAEARRRLEPFAGRVSFVHIDLLEPIPIDDRVDAIFSNAVFHWVRDHDTLFANLAGVLAPGGQLVAQWGGRGNVDRLIAVVRELGPGLAPPYFATAEETAARLRAAGFADIRTWLHDDPADFETRDTFEDYLRTVCLRCHLDLLPRENQDDFVRAVAERLPDRRIDYVRLNATARRG